MENKYVVLGAAMLTFLVGAAVGGSLSSGNKYEDGRLSACKDMLGMMVAINPMLALAQPECKLYKGEAAITVGDKFFSLDGKKQLN